jgi:hypothetical protein
MTDDIVAELAWLATTAIWSGKDPHLRETLRRACDEIVALRAALDEIVKLQAHYAKLLNDYDGGERIAFGGAQEWMDRLRALKDRPL